MRSTILLVLFLALPILMAIDMVVYHHLNRAVDHLNLQITEGINR